MTALLPTQISAMVAAHAPRRGLLIRIATDPVTRLWTGPGGLALDGDDAIDPDEVYRGAGVIHELPALRQLTDGRAERVDFRFPARHPAVIAMMGAGVVGAQIRVAFIFFDVAWALAGPAAWLWDGVVDVTRLEFSAGRYSRILSAVSGAVTRSRGGNRYWSNAGHQSRHPGDPFFERTQGLNISTTRRWP